ncbi:MAG TPA: hypothetical protein VJZ00_15430, partial [Thermoanaerobaculia bacterium]|nr:hypothetical protein [Thermoanaerobaculia bacterium]
MFVCFYVATLILLEWVRFPLDQWVGLIAVSVATLFAVMICEHGRWPLGLFVSPRFAIPEFLIGCAWGIAIIGACVALVLLTSNVREARGSGFPWL